MKYEILYEIKSYLIVLQISKNSGVVTLPHFARIMDYLQILLSADDFNLLAKKYLKNSYTFNYVAFVEAIHQAVQYFDQHGMLDYGGVSII